MAAEYDLAATWAALEAEARGRGRGLVVRRVAPHAAADIFLGRERDTGARVVLVRVSANEADAVVVDLGCGGIEVRAYALDARTPDRVGVGVRLNEARFGDLYDALAADLVRHVAAVSHAEAAAPALLDRLARWQRFLRRYEPGGLSPEDQRGLYAELRCLLEYVGPTLGLVRAVAGWTGPTRADQDFRLGAAAIEVKSHAGHEPQEIRISNARQLDTTGVDCLLLYVLSLDIREGTGQTLGHAVDAVRGALEGTEALDEFEMKLLEGGYVEAQRDRYNDVGYTPRRERFFRVQGGFPRIVETDLRPGVGTVEYGISLGACEPYAVAASDLAGLLAGNQTGARETGGTHG